MQELENGVEPNVGDYDKRTALHLAACEGCTEIVLLLLEKGADVNSTDRWGRTVLADSQTPCYLIDYTEVTLKGAILIGEGAYGEVYKVKWRGTEVAAKTIRSSIASNEKVRKAFLKELALWQKLRHPNIVQFLGVLKDSDRLIFLTEYLKNGSLYDILKKRGRLEPLTAVSYALDIARNVLQDEAGRLKVTDFGLSKIAQEKDVYGYKMTGGTGSYRYMAPEVYRRESYGKSVDVFSFALIVHEMFQGRPSNSEEPPEHVADQRAYEDSRPPLSSYLYPEPVRM
ncbi:putative dual-specificity kinase TKL-Pl-5 family [Helianthus annuus]|nr:putative dual-specificity kinase TKL-Pl-5 family [Helianthus annuus]